MDTSASETASFHHRREIYQAIRCECFITYDVLSHSSPCPDSLQVMCLPFSNSRSTISSSSSSKPLPRQTRRGHMVVLYLSRRKGNEPIRMQLRTTNTSHSTRLIQLSSRRLLRQQRMYTGTRISLSLINSKLLLLRKHNR